MATFAEIQDLKADLIRKVLEASLFVAPTSAPVINAITDASGLLILPAGYEDVGRVDKDAGIGFPMDVTTEDVTSLGAAQPTRRDISSAVGTLTVTPQETKRKTLELYNSMDLSAVEADSTTGEVSFDLPDRPTIRYMRGLALGKDGEGSEAIYVARHLPRMAMTEPGEQSWNDTAALTYPLTFTGFPDDAAGFAQRWFFGGPGWAALAGRHGFPTAAAVNEVQNVAITGAPTGGTFTLTFDALTTTGISYDATAALVQATLEGLANIDPGDVAVTGGPLPATSVDVTFIGQYAGTNVAQMTATGSFTGGTTPAVTVTTTTQGSP